MNPYKQNLPDVSADKKTLPSMTKKLLEFELKSFIAFKNET